MKNLNAGHPVMKSFPANWKTPLDDELYKRDLKNFQIPYLWQRPKETMVIGVPLSGQTHMVRAKVIGITVGHRVESIQDHDYILLLARSLL